MKYEKGSLGYYLELSKKDGFDNIKDWNEWRIKNGKLKSDKKIRDEYYQKKGFKCRKDYEEFLARKRGYKNFGELTKEYKKNTAKNSGYKNYNEWQREYRSSPLSDNKDLPQYLGILTEEVLSKTIKDSNRMPYGYPGFDIICNKKLKIQCKAGVLRYRSNGSTYWEFKIDYNKYVDYFILIAFENRQNLCPVHVWLIRYMTI